MATMAAAAPPAEVPAGDKTGCLMMAMMKVFLTVLVCTVWHNVCGEEQRRRTLQ